MKWQAIVEGIITGVSASVVIAAAVIFKGRIFDNFLKKKVTKSCRRLSVGGGIHGAHVGLSNNTGIPLIIRSVTLMTESSNIVLGASNEIKSFVPRQIERKLTKEEKRKLEAGEHVLVSEDLSFGTTWQEKQHSGGFAELYPYTSRSWNLHPEINPKSEKKLKAVAIEVEYQNFSGTTEVISVITDSHIDGLKSYIDSIQKQLMEGSFNHTRKLFKLPLIKGFPTKEKKAQLGESDNG